jgi:replicative DNA helicase
MKEPKLKYSNTWNLPNDTTSEMTILSILLTNPLLIKDTLPNLKVETFFLEAHQLIYQTLLELFESNRKISLQAIMINLQNKNILQKIGGIEFLFPLFNTFHDPTELNYLILDINKKYIRRSIIELGKNFIFWGYANSENLEILLDKMEESVAILNKKQTIQKVYSAAEIIDELYNELKTKKITQTTSGLKTSFKDLDSIIQGFQTSDLIVIAGRPSMGKTAFSLNLGKNIVEAYNIPLIIFSLEMSRQQIIYRFLSTSAAINTTRLNSGKMTPLEWQSLGTAMKKIAELPIYIYDNPNLSLVDIKSKFRKIFLDKTKMGLVIIDYLQLMNLDFRPENRVQEISHITRSLKILAKEFEIPIIVLSQLNRGVESRTNKRPMLSDLRESGCITKNLETIHSWTKTSILKRNSLSFNFKGIKPTFLISLENDIVISLTSNHKVLSKNGWLQVTDLTLNTNIYCLVKKGQQIIKFGYHKIIKITYEGINSVYDKTIPSLHNYLTKTLILHNSIEQDADIVIMLYREDSYTEKSQNSLLTEFIVAKHRSGPVGTAKLLFIPSISTFKNI